MGTTRLRRPPTPTDPERARSVVARGAGPRGSTTAALVGTGSPVAQPRMHHVHADGSAVLLLAEDLSLVRRLRDDGEVAVMLELADPAPVDLREPVRGLLWITGRLTPVDPHRARRIAVGLSEHHPHPALLGLGHDVTMARLEAGSVVLSDAEGSAVLPPLDLAGARPDPFCHHEHQWLAHLERAHPEVFTALARHLPVPLRDLRGVAVRPLGVDRLGLRLRVETADTDHDVRLAWEAPITTTEELRTQFRRLVGCPVRR